MIPLKYSSSYVNLFSEAILPLAKAAVVTIKITEKISIFMTKINYTLENCIVDSRSKRYFIIAQTICDQVFRSNDYDQSKNIKPSPQSIKRIYGHKF